MILCECVQLTLACSTLGLSTVLAQSCNHVGYPWRLTRSPSLSMALCNMCGTVCMSLCIFGVFHLVGVYQQPCPVSFLIHVCCSAERVGVRGYDVWTFGNAQITPYSLYSALLLTMTHRTYVVNRMLFGMQTMCLEMVQYAQPSLQSALTYIYIWKWNSCRVNDSYVCFQRIPKDTAPVCVLKETTGVQWVSLTHSMTLLYDCCFHRLV